MNRWTLLFATLTALLTVALLRVVRENRDLRARMTVLAAEKARAGGLDLGQRLAPIRLTDSAGAPVTVDFEGGSTGTLLLVHASGCDACAATVPLWREAVASAARPDVRVLCLQTDGADGATLALEGLPRSLAIPLPPSGWLAAIPAVPATLLLDDRGRLAWSNFGELDAQATRDLARAIEHLGMTGAPADGG